MPPFNPLDLLGGFRKVVKSVGNIKVPEALGSNVASEAIRRVEWSPSGLDTNSLVEANISALVEGTLTIEFNERGTYEYYNVPISVWFGLKGAGSKGKYFNDNIRESGYSYSRVG